MWTGVDDGPEKYSGISLAQYAHKGFQTSPAGGVPEQRKISGTSYIMQVIFRSRRFLVKAAPFALSGTGGRFFVHRLAASSKLQLFVSGAIFKLTRKPSNVMPAATSMVVPMPKRTRARGTR